MIEFSRRIPSELEVGGDRLRKVLEEAMIPVVRWILRTGEFVEPHEFRKRKHVDG